MRCGAVITYKERRSQAGTRMAIDPRATVTWYATGDLGPFDWHHTLADYLAKPNTEICDGNVVATVEAEEEPYMGGSSAILSITYKCDKCANDFFPELPQSGEELSAMLTGHIAALDEKSLREQKRDDVVAENERHEAHRQQAMADLKAREEERRQKKAQKGVAPGQTKG